MDAQKLIEVEVYTSFLYPGMILTGDGFDENGNKVVDKNVPLTEEKIRALKSSGIKKIKYTREKPKVRKEVSRQIISDENFSKALEIVDFLQNSVKTEGEKAKIPAREINSVIESFISDIKSNSDAYLNLLELFDANAVIFSHSINVATISMLLGISLKLEDEKIAMLGISALIHDIGKAMIPLEIINKPDKLTEEEWKIVKTHPVRAYKIIKNDPDFPKLISASILTHHEDYSGGGYPLGINHEKISPFAQIISIADVFDAATSIKPYKKPISFDEAFNYIMENSGKKFNPAFAQVFLRDMAKKINEEPIYPVGSFLLLNTGEIAEVAGHRLNEYTLRPIVNIFLRFDSTHKTHIVLKFPIQIDLEKDYSRSVVKRIIDEEKVKKFREILGR
ncbi:MAG: HD-GYP domain-containing protein [Brevinematia bacterium]